MIQASVYHQSGTNTLFYHERHDVDTSATKECRKCHLPSTQTAFHQCRYIRSQKLCDRQMMQFPSDKVTCNRRVAFRQHQGIAFAVFVRFAVGFSENQLAAHYVDEFVPVGRALAVIRLGGG